MAKLKEIDHEVQQRIIKVLAQHWRNNELFNFITGLEEIKKKYSADIQYEILLSLKLVIES